MDDDMPDHVTDEANYLWAIMNVSTDILTVLTDIRDVLIDMRDDGKGAFDMAPGH